MDKYRFATFTRIYKYKKILFIFFVFRHELEKSLGIQEPVDTRDLSIDRNSDPNLEQKVKESSTKDLKELNEEKRRSARRKE